jgi:signal transduction histidine kinase
MMHEFLTTHRTELIDRCRAKVAVRTAPDADFHELSHGIPLFLDQLIKTLRVEQTADPMQSRWVSGPAGGERPAFSEIAGGAAQHGYDLCRLGFTVEQVVHDYGDLCQAITDLAFELNVTIDVNEFRTLNRCLDNAIAGAVTAFNHQREAIIGDEEAKAENQRLGCFAHELRNLLNTATLALQLIKEGGVGVGGATGAILDRSLVGLRILVDRSLTDVRLRAGLTARLRLFSLADFIAELKLSGSLEAKVRECTLRVFPVDPTLALDADRDLLLSAAGNLLQNAFKFTHHGSEVELRAYAIEDRIRIEVQDHCGGLAEGAVEKMFHPFMQVDADRTGLGLGLAIAQSSVEANRGILSVRDLPESGCVFTIDLPRHTVPERTLAPAA